MKALWTISLMIFPLQLVFLNQSDLSQAFKCLVLLPFILKSNFMVLANTTGNKKTWLDFTSKLWRKLVNLRNTFLVWLFQMVVEILLVDFSVHEYSFLVFANLIYLQLGSSALIETYQVLILFFCVVLMHWEFVKNRPNLASMLRHNNWQHFTKKSLYHSNIL